MLNVYLADTRGVLAPDEIHIKSSHRDFKTRDGMETDIIIGDILVGKVENMQFTRLIIFRLPATLVNSRLMFKK
jgi:hypothetical protein